MLQVLARTASIHARKMEQFLREIGSLARCLNFFGACGGLCMAPYGGAEFLLGGAREKAQVLLISRPQMRRAKLVLPFLVWGRSTEAAASSACLTCHTLPCRCQQRAATPLPFLHPLPLL